jgi:ribosomal protein S18 acetylase RimI-like enzyme
MKIREIEKSDFNQYSKLRLEGLKDYQKLTKEKLKLSSQQIKKEFNNFFSDNKRFTFVIEEDKEIKAFIIGTIIKNSYQFITYIDDIFVKKDSRRKGFGKMLMNKFEKWSKSKGANGIRLGVRVNNKSAINLYKKIGYQIRHYEIEKELK